MSNTETPRPSSSTSPEKTFFGQPRMLASLFNVELWERFSFYGMQIIVLLYMYFQVSEGGLGIDEGVAAGIIGAYGGVVYLSAIPGAWVADRLLGPERVLFYSASMIMLGHLSLAVIPGIPGLIVGLLLVAIGSGGVKSNATSLVGTLYAEKDPRRDAGFTIFYMGINIGALVGPLLTGLVRDKMGFHYGFGLAALGMAIGLVQYALTRKHLPAEAHHVADPLPRRKFGPIGAIAVVGVLVVLALVWLGWINSANLAGWVAGIAIAATILYFVIILSNRTITRVERKRVYSFIPLFVASAAFWSLFQQQFTVVALYADKRLDRTMFGWTMPIEWVQSINPIWIIIMAGVFAAIWTKLGDRQPSTPLKFSLALVVMGLAFLVFIPLAGGGPNSTPFLMIVLILFLFTVAELSISPVGLSLATKLAPSIFQTQMVALFFLSVSVGTAVTGVLAGFYDPQNEIPYFGSIGVTAIVLGIALALCRKPISRLMSGVK